MENEQKIEHKSVNIDNDKIWAVVSYIFFPIPLIFAKHKSNFLKYHINQSIILFVVSTIGQIVSGALHSPIFWLPKFIFGAFMIALFVIGVINAVNKKEKPLPTIGKWFSFLK